MSPSFPVLRSVRIASFGVLLAFASAAASRTAPLIDYTTVDAPTVETQCAAALAECDSILAHIVAVPDDHRTFENTMIPLDSIQNVTSQAFGKYAFLGYVSDDKDLRDVCRAQEEAIDKYGIDISFREDVYRAVKAYSETPEAKALEGERARFLKFTLRDYRRNGFGLGPDVRSQVQDLKNRLVELSTEFQKTLAEWEDGIELPPDRTGGLSKNYLDGLKRLDDGNYWVSLDYPDFFPFMDMADDEALRKDLNRRSWNEGYPGNVKLLEEAISVRDRIAKLLGYESWAAYRMEPRMAKTPERVETFLTDLRKKIQPKFDSDIAAMKASYGKDDPDGINYWDWRYYDTKQKLNEYHVDEARVSEYFPLQRVLDGLFDITQEMFGLKYVEVKDPKVWNPDVQLFEIHDASSGDLLAYFYTDLFPRDGKFGHAAAFPLRNGGIVDGKRQLPVSAIVANFTKPTAERPSLLAHDEVETLFHEFGHILHQTLTKVELQRFTGASTEQDFVEAPSQNLEHWVWEPEVLNRFAAHYKTGEKFPPEMLKGLVAAKQLNSGIRWLRQVFYASLDLAYHEPGEHKDTTAILRKLHSICGFPYLDGTHMQAAFGHLFGYDAAYYGYLWSKVYGDDMYTAFQEGGILNPEVGMRYRREIYEKGGTLDGMDLVRNFLGRQPNNKAFLRDLGLNMDTTPAVGSR